MSSRIALKGFPRTARASDQHVDTDYDPNAGVVTNNAIIDEHPKKKTTLTIKKRKLEDNETPSASLLKKEIKQLNNNIVEFDKKIRLQEMIGHPTLKLSNSKQKKPKKMNEYSDEEIDDHIIEDTEPIHNNNNNIKVHDESEDEFLSHDDGDDDFDISAQSSFSHNRPKRESKPSSRYPEQKKIKTQSRSTDYTHIQTPPRIEPIKEVQENHKPIHIVASGSSGSSSSSKIQFKKKPVLPTPKWIPIKVKIDQSILPSSQQAMSNCKKVLAEIVKHPDSFVFREAVDPIALNIPDYFKTILEPMDLGTVQKLLKDKKIINVLGFCQKVRLIWSNAILYNGEHHEIGLLASQLSQLFENRMKSTIEAEKITITPQTIDTTDLKRKIETYTRDHQHLLKELENLRNEVFQSQIQSQQSQSQYKSSNPDDMSPPLRYLNPNEPVGKIEYAEKCSLYNAVSGLQPNFSRGLYELVIDENDKKSMKVFPDYIEIDSDNATPQLLKRIQMYIKDCQDSLNKKDSPPEKQTKDSTTQQEIKEKLSEQSSSTSESDSDSDSESDNDKLRNNFSFVSSSIFEEKKEAIQIDQKRLSELNSSKLVIPTNMVNAGSIGGDGKPVVLLNSDSWSNLSFETNQSNNSMTPPPTNWADLKAKKTQQEQLEKDLQEQESQRIQQIKMKEEEDNKRISDEVAQLKKQAELSQFDKIKMEEEARIREIAKRREAEKARREQELSAQGSLNLMNQFDLMSKFESTGEFQR